MVFKKLFRIFRILTLTSFDFVSWCLIIFILFICWLFGLEAKYFPTGYSRTVLKIDNFLRFIFDCMTWFIVCPIYRYTWSKMQNSFLFWNFCYQGRMNRQEAWFECDLTNVANFFVVLKRLRVQSFHNWCIDKHTCFSLDYFRFENHSVSR